ncbi:hypothetical protein ACI2KR_08355 [Pseudomonas luteola]
MKRQNGFVSIPIDDDIIRFAKQIRAERDRQYGNRFIEEKTDRRELGEVGEMAFGHFLEQYRPDLTEWLVYGETANKPDFIFAGKRIGVKTVKRGVPMRMNYEVGITEHHKDEPVDYYFFCCYELKTNELVLLGGIEREAFIKKAVLYVGGQNVHSNYKIRPGHRLLNIGVSHLTLPEVFVTKILHDYERGLAESAA